MGEAGGWQGRKRALFWGVGSWYRLSVGTFGMPTPEQPFWQFCDRFPDEFLLRCLQSLYRRSYGHCVRALFCRDFAIFFAKFDLGFPSPLTAETMPFFLSFFRSRLCYFCRFQFGLLTVFTEETLPIFPEPFRPCLCHLLAPFTLDI